MSANPQVVAVDTVFRWDGAPQRLARGTVVDVAAGSPLEQAIGKDRLVPLGARAARPEPAAVTDAAAEDEPAAGKRRNGAGGGGKP